MSGVRRAWLDASPGERRGVVTLDGLPERLLIERDGESAFARCGERWRVRLGVRSRDRREAFVSLGGGLDGLLRLPADSALAEGALLQAEVASEPQGGKVARLKLIGPALAGEPGLVTPGPDIETRLQGLAPESPIWRGPEAREAADLAQEAALAENHRFQGGLLLAVQTTRAMTVIDVDLASSGEGAARTVKANMLAIGQAARLLRLKSLGGSVAIDLVGFPKTMGPLMAQAAKAFAHDGPEVVVLPPNRLGVLMLSRPRGAAPLSELLLGEAGRPTPRTQAQALVRALEREGRADPGSLLQAVCRPEVAEQLSALVAELGPRFGVESRPGLSDADTRIQRR